MDIGIFFLATDRAADVATVAQAAEARGFESLWVPEHSHIPVSGATDWTGAPLGEQYARMLDPFVALATAAAVTRTLRLGTGVCLVAQRDPIQLAKQVATLDHVSGGRFELGVGFGWNGEEMRNHRIDPARRRALVREKVLLMRELWTREVATYDGALVRLAPSAAWPKPVQRPHPPIHLGAQAGPTTFAHVAEYCDAWMPSTPTDRRGTMLASVQECRDAVAAAGRDPATVALEIYSVVPEPGLLERCAALGFSRAVLRLSTNDRDGILRALDEHAPVVEAFRSGSR